MPLRLLELCCVSRLYETEVVVHDPHLSVAGDRLKFAIAHDDSSCLRFLCYTAYSTTGQSTR